MASISSNYPLWVFAIPLLTGEDWQALPLLESPTPGRDNSSLQSHPSLPTHPPSCGIAYLARWQLSTVMSTSQDSGRDMREFRKRASAHPGYRIARQRHGLFQTTTQE